MADSESSFPFGFSQLAKLNPLNAMTGDTRMASFDMKAMVDAQQRTAEILSDMGKKSMASMQAIMQRQTEMVRENMKETTSFISQVMQAGTPEEKMACQNEFAKQSFERAMSNSRELVDMMTKANQEAAETVSSHMGEMMTEVRNACGAK